MKIISLLISKITPRMYLVAIGLVILLAYFYIYLDIKHKQQNINNLTTELTLYKDKYNKLNKSFIELEKEHSKAIKALETATESKEKLNTKITKTKKEIVKKDDPIKESVKFIIKDINQ